jgi:hypothetical protein
MKKIEQIIINNLKETSKKLNSFCRASPIMEFLTGIMIAF